MYYFRSTKQIKIFELFLNMFFFYLNILLGTRISEYLFNKLFPLEPEMRGVFTSILNEGDVVIDVGASVGYYTFMAARKASCVYAIEPHPERFLELTRRALKYTNVVPLQKFISDEESIVNIFEERYERKWMPYHPIRNRNYHTYTKFQIHDKAAKPLRIQCTTLTKLLQSYNIQSIGILKIDVEGSEINVLRGAIQILLITNNILIEFHYPNHDSRLIESYRILSDLGFQSKKLSALGTHVHFFRDDSKKDANTVLKQ